MLIDEIDQWEIHRRPKMGLPHTMCSEFAVMSCVDDFEKGNRQISLGMQQGALLDFRAKGPQALPSISVLRSPQNRA